MNTDTGELKSYIGLTPDELDQLNTRDCDPLTKVNEKDMTERQKRRMQVSKHDHRSTLGKKLTAIQQRKKVFGK